MAKAEQVAIDDGPFSIGGYLKAQRTLRGIALEELSVRTRIPLRSLIRLEEGAFDGDPDGFVRGFVRTVADGLGLDPDDTLMRMLAEPGTTKATSRALVGLPKRAWLALAVGLAAALAGAILLHAALWTGPTTRGSDIVIRQDPVRALAEADAAAPTAPSQLQDERRTEAAGQPDLPDVSGPPR